MFPRISSSNSRRRLLFFFALKGGYYLWEAAILNIAHWKSCPKYVYFVFNTITLNKKNNHITHTERGLYKCSKFGFLDNFQC